MELNNQLLILYFIFWVLASIILVKVIADRSVQKWVERFDKDVNPEGADLLLHLLKPVMEEIFSDNEQLLKDFKTSFFATVAPQVREAKKIVGKLNPAGAAIEELTKDNPLLSLILSHLDLGNIVKAATNTGDTSNNTGLTSDNIVLTSDNSGNFGL